MSIEPTNRRSVGLLALAPNLWDGPWMNRQQLLSRLARDYDVLYSTGPISKYPYDLPQPRLLPRCERRENVAVDLLPTWMAAANRWTHVGDAVKSLLVHRWKRFLGNRPLVAWCFHPKYWPLVAALQPQFLIYHAYDLYGRQRGYGSELDDREASFVKAANLVVASSVTIAEHLRSLGARAPVVIENAADYEAFAVEPATDPDDLAAIPRPRIGYVGALNRKVDFSTLLQVATRRPDWQIVLVGAIGNLDVVSESAITALRSISNVHFLGFKDRRILPSYMASMDVNLMAYRMSAEVWTEGIYPLKLHEYLAVGRPVVSADLPSVRPFDGVIGIVQGDQSWEAAIASALRSPSLPAEIERRRVVARANTWESRVTTLDTCLQAMLGRTGEPSGQTAISLPPPRSRWATADRS